MMTSRQVVREASFVSRKPSSVPRMSSFVVRKRETLHASRLTGHLSFYLIMQSV